MVSRTNQDDPERKRKKRKTEVAAFTFTSSSSQSNSYGDWVLAICKNTSVESFLPEERPGRGLDVSRVVRATSIAREKILMEFAAEIDVMFSSLAGMGWRSAVFKIISGKLHYESCDGEKVEIKTCIRWNTTPSQILADCGFAVRSGKDGFVVSWAEPLRWDRSVRTFAQSVTGVSLSRGEYHKVLSHKIVFRQVRTLLQPCRKLVIDLPLPARKLLMEFSVDAASLAFLNGSCLRSMSCIGQDRKYAELDKEVQQGMMAAAAKGQSTYWLWQGLSGGWPSSWMPWMEADNFAELCEHFKQAGLTVETGIIGPCLAWSS